MAVTHNSYKPTEHLILSKPRKHYRTGVRWQHWQLRALIGSKGQNAVYFPVSAGSEPHPVHIQQLNTTTGEQETVKHLGFVPMCLVGRNGWVCAGGEKGAFAAFRVGDTAEEIGIGSRLGLSYDRDGHLIAISEPDGRNPIPLDDPAAEEAVFASLARARDEKNMLARNRIFGKHRVNGITLWFPPTLQEPCKGAYDQGVAVLANNDKGVTVVNLQHQDALDEIKYPDFMNLAVISPDGQLLVAISDDPYLYIHRRTEKECDKRAAQRRPWEAPPYEWSECGKIQLLSQSKDDRSDHRSIPPPQGPFRMLGHRLTDNRGSFAACFSSTGKYLAVGTQYGTISIFNVASLTLPGVDPLVTHFQTSRSNVEFGAVRDMAFAPGPVDLLAWTEDRGRVGIADSRTGFDSRQIIHFEEDSDYDHITVMDRSTIDPRLLEQRSDRTRGSGEASNSADTSSRPSRTSELLENLNIPLTAEETVVLEAIQDHRRRQEQWTANLTRLGIENAAGSGSGTGSGSGAGRRPGAGGGTATGSVGGTRAGAGGGGRRAPPSAWPARDRSASVSRAVDDILGTIRSRQELGRSSYMQGLTARERAAIGEDGATTSSAGDRPIGDSPATAPSNTTTALNANSAPAPERRRYDSNPSLRSGVSTGNGIPLTSRDLSERLARFHRLTSLTTNPYYPYVGNSPPPSGWDNAEALYDPHVLIISRSIQPTTASAGQGVEQAQREVPAVDSNGRVSRANYLMRDWEDGSTRRIFGSLLTNQPRPEPYDTAGLSWSESGDIL
ncbi:hypothetical protein QBC43DRAFT_343859 [Cladorrhinum sp. PSN259]|nr:hypothetical protein QBC43DRAFT_343859 [Cladorrhinum sp. PSN259]